jgi:PD-(D/E)XK nuclease superfamily protein
MNPTSLSASALKVYLECSARFNAEYVERIRVSGPSGSAGDLGSLVHAVLEWYVKDGAQPDSKLLSDKCKALAPSYGINGDYLKSAVKMLLAWYDRWHTDPVEFDVLQVEVKETFNLVSTTGQAIPVTYIWDRVDRLANDGSIRVVDYKSWIKALTADDTFNDTQVRIYALAAAIKYKADKPPYIWVQLDQLRYGSVTVRFSREDIAEIWQWLRNLYTQILDDDGKRETVGSGCYYCVRTNVCKSYQKAVAAGTIVSFSTPEEAARKVAEINAVLPQLMETKSQLIAYLESYLKDQGWLEERFQDDILVKVTPKRSRSVDHNAAVDAVGVEIAARSGKLGVTVIDELLSGDELDDDQKDRLRKAVSEGFTTSTNAIFK